MEIKQFDFENHQVRTVEKDGEVWFIAKDICDTLGIDDVSNAIKPLHEAEKLIRILYVSGQNRNVMTINESGLYALIFKSRKPNAEKFRLWVTGEVIPSIRKTGSYSLKEKSPLVIVSEALIIANGVMHDQAIQIAEQQEYIEKIEPKAESYDRIYNSKHKGILIETALKALGFLPHIGLKEFFALLRKDRVLRSEGTRLYEPYTEYELKKYFHYTPTKFYGHDSGTARLTGRGMFWIEEKYAYIKNWPVRERYKKEQEKAAREEARILKGKQMELFHPANTH